MYKNKIIVVRKNMFKIETDVSVTFYKALVEDFLQIINRILQTEHYQESCFQTRTITVKL